MPHAHFILRFHRSGFILASSPSSVVASYKSSFYRSELQVLPPSWQIANHSHVMTSFKSSFYNGGFWIFLLLVSLGNYPEGTLVLIVGGGRSTSSL
ncbi:hypothetical protein C4D60_Mb08t04100 [Musa balbisiana]|uniref:Uncharacterized protein n=1 Tax=Musa balbisiana TaxID=52838 RepID=A0A4S8K1A3_MUSBA|nr:hypothetical protein C4D60_Mb08t04100 [Musa balbisiana]